MSSELELRRAQLTRKVAGLEELLVERRALVAERQAALVRAQEAVAKASAAILQEQLRQAALKARYEATEARAWDRVKATSAQSSSTKVEM